MKQKVLKKRGAWTFSGKLPDVFYSHIKKSVPLYEEGHKIILQTSDFFLKDNSICYDLGCSSLDLLVKLSKFSNKKIKLIGVDCEKDMVKFCKKRINKEKINNINIVCKDIHKMNLLKSDLIISYYTMQFIPPKFRQVIINKIYKSLNWGGAFICFEKIRGADARFQDIFVSLYNDFKEDNGFSLKEINNKQKSIRGILEPFSEQGNLGLLKRAGFRDISGIMQFINFKGYLCIK
jgi:tRNA (cmo5U34)-methyltransferase